MKTFASETYRVEVTFILSYDRLKDSYFASLDRTDRTSSHLMLSSATIKSGKTVFSVVANLKIWFCFSGFLLLFSAIAIGTSMVRYGSPVKLGLDFVGGTKTEYKFSVASGDFSAAAFRTRVLQAFPGQKMSDSIVQTAPDNTVILRTQELSIDEQEALDTKLRDNFGDFSVVARDTVSASIGPELLNSGLIALGVCLAGILLFVGVRFRRDFAICAIIALLHDVLIVVGAFAFLGLWQGLEVNTLFLTACLTVLGFSIHDTIVVFDRIRENMKIMLKRTSFSRIVDESIAQVWFRSLCTSLTVLITLFCLLLFGGETTQIFSGAMFIGIIAGSYSSIFVAAAALGWWNDRKGIAPAQPIVIKETSGASAKVKKSSKKAKS